MRLKNTITLIIIITIFSSFTLFLFNYRRTSKPFSPEQSECNNLPTTTTSAKKKSFQKSSNCSILIFHEHLLHKFYGCDIRLSNLITTLKSQNCKVYLYGLSVVSFTIDNQYTREILGSTNKYAFIPNHVELIANLITKRKYDAILSFTWFWLKPSVTELVLSALERIPPNVKLSIPLVALTDDAHAHRSHLLANLEPIESEKQIFSKQANEIQVRESNIFQRVDFIACLTRADCNG